MRTAGVQPDMYQGWVFIGQPDKFQPRLLDPAPHALLHDVLHRDLAVDNGPCEPTLSKHPCDGKNGIWVNP